MQGFNIENNVEYYCKRTVTIPKDYANKRVFLRFEGVYSNARVWVNNKYCACHTGGFTAWDVDISEFSKLGEITLTIGIADLDQLFTSFNSLNPEHQRMVLSFSSFLEQEEEHGR